MRLGKNMKHALGFISRCSGWHTFARDRATVDAIKRLEKLGLVEVNFNYSMFRLAGVKK